MDESTRSQQAQQNAMNVAYDANAADASEARTVSHITHESIILCETDVCALIAARETNRVISRRLDLSPDIVKRHVANILRKLAVDLRGPPAAR